MKAGALRLAVLALPLAGLAAAWGWTEVRAGQGTEWEVPVSASGPRASLRGRYVRFRYDWKLPEGVDGVEALCLDGAPPRLVGVRATVLGDRHCGSLARAAPGGILYVPQEQVPAIRDQLADRALAPIVRIRVNDSGAITPLSLRFEPAALPDQSGLPSLSR